MGNSSSNCKITTPRVRARVNDDCIFLLTFRLFTNKQGTELSWRHSWEERQRGSPASHTSVSYGSTRNQRQPLINTEIQLTWFAQCITHTMDTVLHIVHIYSRLNLWHQLCGSFLMAGSTSKRVKAKQLKPPWGAEQNDSLRCRFWHAIIVGRNVLVFYWALLMADIFNGLTAAIQ